MDTNTTDREAPEWTNTHWLESKWGRRFIVLDILLIIGILAVLVQWFRYSIVEDPLSGRLSVYCSSVSAGFDVTRLNVLLFTLLGALGYVFTPLYKDIHRSVGELLEYHFRLVGAIPLGFGVFLLSDYLLQDNGIGVLALAFLAGLYVNTFYKRIGAIADYVLPPEEDGTDGGDESGANGTAGEQNAEEPADET